MEFACSEAFLLSSLSQGSLVYGYISVRERDYTWVEKFQEVLSLIVQVVYDIPEYSRTMEHRANSLVLSASWCYRMMNWIC